MRAHFLDARTSRRARRRRKNSSRRESSQIFFGLFFSKRANSAGSAQRYLRRVVANIGRTMARAFDRLSKGFVSNWNQVASDRLQRAVASSAALRCGRIKSSKNSQASTSFRRLIASGVSFIPLILNDFLSWKEFWYCRTVDKQEAACCDCVSTPRHVRAVVSMSYAKHHETEIVTMQGAESMLPAFVNRNSLMATKRAREEHADIASRAKIRIARARLDHPCPSDISYELARY
ncbi:MAG: hypothetical protein ABI399_03045 [Bauldia sp.]